MHEYNLQKALNTKKKKQILIETICDREYNIISELLFLVRKNFLKGGVDMQLPYSEELNIEYLGRLFANTSECYKWISDKNSSSKSNNFAGVSIRTELWI